MQDNDEKNRGEGMDKEIQDDVQLLQELLDAIDAGEFSKDGEIPAKYTFKYLKAIWNLQAALDGGEKFYRQIYEIAIKCGISCIQQKLKKKKKVNVAFLTISAAEWPAESVYRLLEHNPKVEEYLVICPLMDRSMENMEDAFEKTASFFEKHGYNTRRAYDKKNKKVKSWDEIGKPDIVIHLSHWYQAFPKEYQIENYPFSILNCYIPYSMSLADNNNGTFMIQSSNNTMFSNMMWHIYTDTMYHYEGYKKYQLLRGENVIFTGFPKMDFFYSKNEKMDLRITNYWKIPEDCDSHKMKKIIIAPHHSFLGYGGILYSTFQWNMYFWIYLAKKYEKQISFVFKPHPNLRARSIEAGIFRNEEDFEQYIKLWENLPNGRVSLEESYLEIFETSDGMIMDSNSFLAEYMYANKPLLFLTREEQTFNELGKSILDVYDQRDGRDYIGIAQFIEDVILKENDDKKKIREDYFKNHLDYCTLNGCLAGQKIYNDIISLF